MLITEDTIIDDLAPNDYGETDIINAVKRVRYLHKKLQLPYYELMRSKHLNTLRYLVVELNNKKGSILITDLDSGKTHTFS